MISKGSSQSGASFAENFRAPLDRKYVYLLLGIVRLGDPYCSSWSAFRVPSLSFSSRGLSTRRASSPDLPRLLGICALSAPLSRLLDANFLLGRAAVYSLETLAKLECSTGLTCSSRVAIRGPSFDGQF